MKGKFGKPFQANQLGIDQRWWGELLEGSFNDLDALVEPTYVMPAMWEKGEREALVEEASKQEKRPREPTGNTPTQKE